MEKKNESQRPSPKLKCSLCSFETSKYRGKDTRYGLRRIKTHFVVHHPDEARKIYVELLTRITADEYEESFEGYEYREIVEGLGTERSSEI